MLKFDDAIEAKKDPGCPTVPAGESTTACAVFSVTRAVTKNLHLVRIILHYHTPHSYAQRKQSQKHFAEKS
jgi:hypothetical protein